jgi:hypothetical protein
VLNVPLVATARYVAFLHDTTVTRAQETYLQAMGGAVEAHSISSYAIRADISPTTLIQSKAVIQHVVYH